LLDLVDEIAARPDVHLEIEFAPGDIQLLSNRSVMHARSTFVDWDEPERRRHLLRLWLSATTD
jgi:alpha-ketoglutarate-dependent taurine dioxygenase